MRSERSEETEFVTVNLFESLDAVTSFAGLDYEAPVFEPEAGRLLSRVEPISRHYDVRKAPDLVKMTWANAETGSGNLSGADGIGHQKMA